MENVDKTRRVNPNNKRGERPKVVWIRQPSMDTRRIMTHKEKTRYIIDGSMEYLGFDEAGLSAEKRPTKEVSYAKRYLVPILYDYTKASMSEIARLLGFRNHSSVSQHYQNLKDELSEEAYGCDKTKLVYRELLAYLGIDSEGHIKRQESNEETGEVKG